MIDSLTALPCGLCSLPRTERPALSHFTEQGVSLSIGSHSSNIRVTTGNIATRAAALSMVTLILGVSVKEVLRSPVQDSYDGSTMPSQTQAPLSFRSVSFRD